MKNKIMTFNIAFVVLTLLIAPTILAEEENYTINDSENGTNQNENQSNSVTDNQTTNESSDNSVNGVNETQNESEQTNETNQTNNTENVTENQTNVTEQNVTGNESDSNETQNETDINQSVEDFPEEVQSGIQNESGNESEDNDSVESADLEVRNANESFIDKIVRLFVKDWYPKGSHYVFVCENNFNATTFDWYYGDGHKLLDISNGDTYHIYERDGEYQVKCIAKNGNQSAENNLTITVVGAGNETPVNNGTNNQTNQTGNQSDVSFNVSLVLEERNEVPPVNETGAMGYADARIDGNNFIIDGNFSNLSSDVHIIAGSSAHIHSGGVNQTGPVIWSVPVSVNPDNRSGTFQFIATISEEQRNSIMSGNYYINVHSQNYPNGEIRAQISNDTNMTNVTNVTNGTIVTNQTNVTNQTGNLTNQTNQTNVTNQTGNFSSIGLTRLDSGGIDAVFSCAPENYGSNLLVDWDFGDNQTVNDSGSVISHSFSGSGDYYVMCNVTDQDSGESTILANMFSVSE